MAAVLTVKDRMPGLRSAVRALSVHRVLVGVPAENAFRGLEEREPINNAALAYIHDHGAPAANIPARPFMRPGILTVRTAIDKTFRDTARAAFDGRPYDVDRTLNVVGLMAATAIKAKITAGPFAPLAPATLAARRRRGRKSDKPLIDTGAMRNAITYVIRDATKARANA